MWRYSDTPSKQFSIMWYKWLPVYSDTPRQQSRAVWYTLPYSDTPSKQSSPVWYTSLYSDTPSKQSVQYGVHIWSDTLVSRRCDTYFVLINITVNYRSNDHRNKYYLFGHNILNSCLVMFYCTLASDTSLSLTCCRTLSLSYHVVV